MGEIVRRLYVLVKNQCDRILRWTGCPPVTGIIVDVFTSSSEHLSSTQKQKIRVVLFGALYCLSFLIIFKKYLYDEDQNLPSPDEIFADKLQLQEVLEYSYSTSQTAKAAKSSSSKKGASSSSIHSTSKPGQALKSKPANALKPAHALKMKQPMVTSEISQSSESFCAICMDTKPASEMFSYTKVCCHRYCSNCICQHVSAKIKENIIKVKCPNPICKGVIEPQHCKAIIPKEVIERWDEALCDSLILVTPNFYCPFKSCSAMLVDDGGEAVTCHYNK